MFSGLIKLPLTLVNLVPNKPKPELVFAFTITLLPETIVEVEKSTLSPASMLLFFMMASFVLFTMMALSLLVFTIVF